MMAQTVQQGPWEKSSVLELGRIPGRQQVFRSGSFILGSYIPSLVAQMVKNLPAMQEIWVQSLGGEDPLEKEMATQSSMLAWRE